MKVTLFIEDTNIDMTKAKPRSLRAIIFIIISCIIFGKLNSIFVLKWTERNASEIRFLLEPKNSINVLFLGASSFYKGISPLVMWNEYGFTSYVRSSTLQSPLGLYNSLLEALDNQSPDLVVLDGITLLNDYNYHNREPRIRKYIDPKPFSVRKIQFIYNLWKYEYDTSVGSYFFPIFRYHDRWKSLQLSDFSSFELDTIVNTKGQSITRKVSSLSYSSDYMQETTKIGGISKEASIFYDKIIDICNERSIKVLFVTLPRLNWSYQKHNSVKTYAEKNDVPYIDLSFPQEMLEIDLNLDTDFFDKGHLNLSGSQKTSIFLGGLIKNSYKLPDLKDDTSLDYWNEQYTLYKEKYLDHPTIVNSEETIY